MKVGQFVEWQKNTGDPIYQTEALTIRPISRSLSIWWRPYGGWVWNRPAGIEITENNQVREMPIVDVNLWAQVGLAVMTALFSLLLWLKRK
jgi:hypothetical protein